VSLLVLLFCGAVRAEDLDQGKSAQRLFADSCAACHKSAKGLTKRGYLTLYFFLKDHYASNSTSAWALTSYLESVDDTPRGHQHKSAERASPPAPQAKGASGGPPRPPASVPQR
jgi:mono/diheme cytochrome c family protein